MAALGESRRDGIWHEVDIFVLSAAFKLRKVGRVWGYEKMPYGISIKSRNATAINIVKLSDEASTFEPVSSMQELDYPPHITLVVFPDHPGDGGAIMAEVFSAQDALLVAFEAVEYFDNDHLVLWAKPCFDQPLFDLHAALHKRFDSLICHEHYRVGSWVPHCSLATKVPYFAKSAAVEWAKNKRISFSVSFDLADFVEFPPVIVRSEFCLR
jgi:2'-5' RNA ligase